MGLRRFERRLENLVEGTIDRVFRPGLSPLDIARRLAAEIDANIAAGPGGAPEAPNHFWVYLASADYDRLAGSGPGMITELERAARTHIQDERLNPAGAIQVELVEAPDYSVGAIHVHAGVDRTRPPAPAAMLIFETGDRIELASPATIGRDDESTIVLHATDASRNHAVIEARGDMWFVQDLGSTNGTALNGSPIVESGLYHNDRLAFGSTRAIFHLTV